MPLHELFFFMWDQLLTYDVPIKWLQHVTQIVLALDNQKNIIRGELVPHFRFESAASYQVRSGVNTLLQIQERGFPEDTLVRNYPNTP